MMVTIVSGESDEESYDLDDDIGDGENDDSEW